MVNSKKHQEIQKRGQLWIISKFFYFCNFCHPISKYCLPRSNRSKRSKPSYTHWEVVSMFTNIGQVLVGAVDQRHRSGEFELGVSQHEGPITDITVDLPQ